MATKVDTKHEVNFNRRVADVRPWSEQTREKLSDSGNFFFFFGCLVAVVWLFPVTLPVVAVVFLIAHFSVLGMKNILPYRYPAHKGIHPQTREKGDGILYIGGVRSESQYENFKQCWLSDSDLRKHWLVIGSTGSGKSEALKGIFFNTLCWGAGFFCADGKADNTLPTDGYAMARGFGRDDDYLALNFLLGGKTPQQVGNSRRRRSNRLNPFSSGDADTLIQMGANLLPKAEGDGKSWQEKALAVWRAVITALCYKRDTTSFTLSVGAIIDYLSLNKIEELYVDGFHEAARAPNGVWSYGYSSIKNYLDSGLPGYSVEKLLKKHNLTESTPATLSPMTGAPKKPPGREVDQDPSALEQHGYRVGQLMPVLNLLDKTYGYIFRAPFSEIDMIDVALHNRILFLLIPSLEKSSQEAENLGKLSIACLRVMMARNLGSDLEGNREELIESKATNAPYPYLVALDELGYYFADGIAVMFAQARGLGMSMLAATQDLKKLTEGSRASEAGSMIGNALTKLFLKVDDPDDTWKLVSGTLGKIQVAEYAGYESGNYLGGFKRDDKLTVRESDVISPEEIRKFSPGQGVMNALGVTRRISTFYMGKWLSKLNNSNFHLNRFLQVYDPSSQDILDHSIAIPKAARSAEQLKEDNANKLVGVLKGQRAAPADAPAQPIFTELSRIVGILNEKVPNISPFARGVSLYLGLKSFINAEATGGAASGDAHDIISPASLPILGSAQTIHLAQALDEYGLSDPLALIRKPIAEVLARIKEDPIREPAQDVISHAGSTIEGLDSRPRAAWPKVAAPISQELDFSAPDVNPLFAQTSKGDPSSSNAGRDLGSPSFDQGIIDEILREGRPASKSVMSEPDMWLVDAVTQAESLSENPRSVDHSVVALSADALVELEGLEKELGNDRPKTAARTIQKVVAAQVTPQTVGKGEPSSDEIDAFFNNIART